MFSDGWWLRSAMPWVKRCLSGGTILYAQTQKGEMPMMVKDLVRLKPETIKLWNGDKWTQVMGFNKTIPNRGDDQKKRRAFRRRGDTIEPQKYLEIELRSGERIGCTNDHRWPTMRGLLRTDELQIGDIVDKYTLPAPKYHLTPNFLPSESIGWLVGMFIAEGCIDKNSIKIHGHDKEINRHKQLKHIAEMYGDSFSTYSVKDSKATVAIISGKVIRSIINTYVNGKLSKGKHLSSDAWQRSNTFLEAILRGYLEGDGHWDELAARWRLGFTKNDALAADIRCICARLGYSIRLKRVVHKITGSDKKYPGWRGQIRIGQKVPINANTTSFKLLHDTEIVKIRTSRAQFFYDIEVKDAPNVFSLASGVLTHNSAMPESCTDRPASALEYMFLLTKSSKYYFDMDAIRKEHKPSSIERVKHGWNGKSVIDEDGKERRAQPDPTDHMGDRWATPAGRNFRNTDLFYQSLEEPHGAIFCGDEMVGLDVNPQAYSEAHFATFPEWLVTPLIKAGTSEKGACPECGAPWERVVEKDGGTIGRSWHDHSQDDVVGMSQYDPKNHKGGLGKQEAKNGNPYKVKTIGWQPTCKCGHKETVPCVVLDPFGGSGTTKNVADRLGRRGIMCELKMEYIEMAKKRCYRLPELF